MLHSTVEKLRNISRNNYVRRIGLKNRNQNYTQGLHLSKVYDLKMQLRGNFCVCL